jgi:hypothetical protein
MSSERGDDLPVHESLTVLDSEAIYQTDDWWKAVVRYHYGDPDDSEVAVYLWHRDGEWTRKNKYVVKTGEAWETDKLVIESLLQGDGPSVSTDELPVSDYYSLGAGKSIFKTDQWWKAIVQVTQKGEYETNNVMVYLWQRQDGEWRRRQKYTVKSESKWAEESATIEKILSRAESDGEYDAASAAQENTEGTAASGGGRSLSTGSPDRSRSLSTVGEDELESSPESHLSGNLD